MSKEFDTKDDVCDNIIMHINFADYDLTEFAIKEGVFGGIWSKLITPIHIGTKFTQKNKIFRSSIWSTDGELISAGLPKFVNFSENPHQRHGHPTIWVGHNHTTNFKFGYINVPARQCIRILFKIEFAIHCVFM